MKRRFWPILSLVLALACGALLFLWQGERAEPDVGSLRLHGMTEAHARFSIICAWAMREITGTAPRSSRPWSTALRPKI